MRRFIICMTFLCLFSSVNKVNGQTWNLPDNRPNDRFTSDHFDIPRPALSMRSFDNTKSDNYNHTYSPTTFGVRQVLERAYGINASQEVVVKIPYEQIIIRSKSSLQSFESSNAEHNSSILESMAFVSLMSFIIEQNDGDSGEPNIFTTAKKDLYPNMPNHNTALNDFIGALEDKEDYFRHMEKNNAFHRSGALMKVSRAWDLYLALENAYEDLGGNLSNLLSSSDKQWWNDAIHAEIKRLWQDSNGNLPLGSGGWDGWSAGLQLHEVQAGNWPLIAFVATGYAALGFNGSFTPFNDDNNTFQFQDPNSLVKRGLKSVAFHYTNSNDKRFNYWWFQTGEGRPFWAEGPYYYEVALAKVIEFWHVIRANGMLSFSSEGDGIDPFNNPDFLTPLNWHADIATPVGNTPPLDDGNNEPIKSSVLLSWNDDYGDINTGKKFAYIRDLNSHGIGNVRDHRLVEISIPRLSINSGTAPPNNYGNTSSSSKWHKQLVSRYKISNNEHYVLLNGESSSAITRGEGHEQPDQMQLLYYIDGISFLMDRGYDSATGTSNSTWNTYRNHNVMNFVSTTEGGGLRSPYLGTNRKISDHNDIVSIHYTNHGSNITELNSSVTLGIYDLGLNGYYDRNILFIKGNKPYLIDFNSLKTSVYDSERFNNNIGNYGTNFHEGIFYHGFSNTFASSGQWNYWDIYGTNKNLYMYLKPVELGNVSISNQLVSSEEAYRDSKDIRRATLLYPYAIPNLVASFERDLTTMAILVADDVSQPDPEPIFSYQNDLGRPHQAWVWSPGNDILDVIAKRSKSHTQIYDDTLTFNVVYQSEFIAYLSLPANKDYGFARLEKVNDEWVIDNQYAINISQEEPIPTTPANLVISNLGSPGNPNLEWDWTNFTNIDLDYFEVYRKKKRLSDAYVFPLELLGTTTNETFTDVSVIMDQVNQHPYDYQYTVAAVSTEDKSSPYSNYTNWVNAATPFKGAPEKEKEPMPESFGLAQNYPNPFNPTTQIKFDLPEDAEVSIRVYNIMGQVVADLVHTYKKAGFHKISFDAGNLASGVYIAKMNATGTSGEVFTREIKMQLIK